MLLEIAIAYLYLERFTVDLIATGFYRLKRNDIDYGIFLEADLINFTIAQTEKNL